MGRKSLQLDPQRHRQPHGRRSEVQQAWDTLKSCTEDFMQESRIVGWFFFQRLYMNQIRNPFHFYGHHGSPWSKGLFQWSWLLQGRPRRHRCMRQPRFKLGSFLLTLHSCKQILLNKKKDAKHIQKEESSFPHAEYLHTVYIGYGSKGAKRRTKKGHVYSHVVVECITNLCFGPLCFESWRYYDHESACGILQPATLVT